MALFEPDELKKWLHYSDESQFSTADAQVAEQVVAGWLADAIDVDDLTDLDPSVLSSSRFRAWALELGGIAYENPTSMSQDNAAEIASQWQLDRRRQILDSVRAWAATRRPDAASAVPRPRGSFPPPVPWPDDLHC